jgi:hypothetical protein
MSRDSLHASSVKLLRNIGELVQMSIEYAAIGTLFCASIAGPLELCPIHLFNADLDKDWQHEPIHSRFIRF